MDFWDSHSILFVIAMFFFPRLTMLFFTSYGGGLLYWLGWLFAPRLTVAIIATMLYGDTNIVMVVLAWFWALGGESTEKVAAARSRSKSDR